jgi:hypothetical protein
MTLTVWNTVLVVVVRIVDVCIWVLVVVKNSVFVVVPDSVVEIVRVYENTVTVGVTVAVIVVNVVSVTGITVNIAEASGRSVNTPLIVALAVTV